MPGSKAFQPAKATYVIDDPLQPQSCAERLKALSDPCRLRIVSCLREGPRNVSEISSEIDVSIVTVSHHLGILKAAGLVQSDRDGRFIVYRLPAEVFQRPETSTGLDYLDLGCCRLEMPKDSTSETSP